MPYKKKDDYNRYMQKYMIQWRRQQAAMLKRMRKQLGIPQPKRGPRKKAKR